MLELITASGNVSIRDTGNDYAVTHKYSGVDTLHFELDLEDPVFPLLELEGLVYEQTEAQTYLIRGSTPARARQRWTASFCWTTGGAEMYLDYQNKSATLPDTLNPVLPEGWALAWEDSFPAGRS